MEGKQNSLIPVGAVIKCFVIPPNSKIEKIIHQVSSVFAANLPWFQGTLPDQVRVKCSSCCFLRELVSFVHPTELDCFGPWPRHILVQSTKAFELGGITRVISSQQLAFMASNCSEDDWQLKV